MQQLIIYLLFGTMLLFSSQIASAADKTKALLALEQTRNAVNELNQRSSGNSLIDQDIALARRYLQQAEELYKNNVSWVPLRGLSDAVEPEILDLAEIAEQTARIGLSKIDRQTAEQEYLLLDKKTTAARDKIRVLEEQAAELVKLKANASRLAEIKLDQASLDKLKQENSALVQQLETMKNEKKLLLTQQQSLKVENASLAGQLEAIHADKKMDELQIKKQQERIMVLEKEQVSLQQKKQEALQSGTKLSAAERAATFKEKLSTIGAVTDITDTSLVLVLPRRNLIKTTGKGHQLAPDAEQQARLLLALMGQYPEYQLSLQVFGYGKPIKQEGLKAAKQMAHIVRDFFALRMGVKADTLSASGSVAASPLFSTATADPHRRIELKFTIKP